MQFTRKTVLYSIGMFFAMGVLFLQILTSSRSGAGLNPQLQPSVEWAHLDKQKISVELKITGVNSLEPFLLTCPINKITLRRSSGEVLSVVENIFTCWNDENNNFFLSQTFDHNLIIIPGEPQAFILDLLFSGGEQFNIDLNINPSESSTFFPGQIVSKNNVKAELKSIEINKSTIIAEICFDFPSLSDWMVFPYIEGEMIDGSMATLLDHDEDVMDSPHRCYEFKLFNYSGFSTQTKNKIILKIDEIISSMPEQLSPETIEKANQISSIKGVTFEVIPADHSWGLEIVSKPEEMSDEDAYNVAMESIPEKVIGPWSFTVELP